MRFMIMHRTTPHWEAGALPGPELIARVGKMLGEMTEAGVLRGAEGLRPSSQGVRLGFSGGKRTVTKGPFTGSNELPAGFAILRVKSIEEAIGWASRFAAIMDVGEIDIRPVTEPWDLGMSPKPPGLTTSRFMALHKMNECDAVVGVGCQTGVFSFVTDGGWRRHGMGIVLSIIDIDVIIPAPG